MKKSKNNNIILGFSFWVLVFGFSWCKWKIIRVMYLCWHSGGEGGKKVRKRADVIYGWSPIPTSSLSSWRAKAVLSLVTASKDACRSNSFWPRSPASDIVVCCCASSRLARRLLTSYGFPKKSKDMVKHMYYIFHFLLLKAGISFLFYTLEFVTCLSM